MVPLRQGPDKYSLSKASGSRFGHFCVLTINFAESGKPHKDKAVKIFGSVSEALNKQCDWVRRFLPQVPSTPKHGIVLRGRIDLVSS